MHPITDHSLDPSFPVFQLTQVGAVTHMDDYIERRDNSINLQDSHISGSDCEEGEADGFEDFAVATTDYQPNNDVKLRSQPNRNNHSVQNQQIALPAFHHLDAAAASVESNSTLEVSTPEPKTLQGIENPVSGSMSTAVMSGPRPMREILNMGPRKPSAGLTKRWPSLAQVVSRDAGIGQPRKQTQGHSTSVSSAPPPPPPPPPPPAPPLPQSRSTPSDQGEDNSSKMSVKRINWEKLDNQKVENTIWEKLNSTDLRQVVKYLELEAQFSTKPSKQRDVEKKSEVLIMDQRKAYNISILLGHLKMSVPEVKQALYSMDEKALAPELIGQLLAFAPSEAEIAQYKAYTGDHSRLTKPDQFAYQISLVGDYEERLKALLFKASFKEKVEELRKDLENIKLASKEIRTSKKLAGVLEVILAMGNYLNKGNSRVGEAAGFRITFLTQLDITKTTDNKSSFLHVLAEAAYSRFPELLSFSDELSTVEKAAKVSTEVLNQDIQDLKRNLEATSAVLSRVGDHSHNSPPGDRFHDVMGHFLAEATDELQSIFRLQAAAMTEFSQMVIFFGEDPKTMTTNDVFGIFSDFINNFEKAHRYNLMFKRQ
ncbi:glutamate receptor, ionotropic, delta 2 (grid2) interacting protein, b [Plakobranchus ocellatus]|uniref:Glutamate receptor, ionotropic, delta 2 (Grid2) interacting protein, b n=1 Tax=Plakobranchus ocellatus TaxID=259542 RepID=A0AAV4CJV7_9GAST|nr:glutamate receptor, ionotropic, delta 2 (grid2) interacting protein, b [Plakobranchus ocellatus]